MVTYGCENDIQSWMDLVRKVSWNFPGLKTEEDIVEHNKTVLRFMGEHRALCVKEKDIVIGVLLFSTKYNMICCLAVMPEYRNRGIGSELLRNALDKLDSSKDIIVTTFREEDEKGKAPRALYKKFGFSEDELIEEFGYPNQRFVLRSL